MKRRKFIGTSVAAGIGISAVSAQVPPKNRQKLFRIVQVTDMHIFKSLKVENGLTVLLNEIHTLNEKPDFVLNTGDVIMDALKRSKNDVEVQWNSYHKYFKNKLQYPMYACIGNHDVWGWGISEKMIKEDAYYGKNWAISELDMEHRYYCFEHKGWKFICLDSPHFSETSKAYTAKLDDEQFTWLQKELENTKTNTNICIVSHIPILSPSVFYDGDNVVDGNWSIPGAWMHIDSKKIKSLFYKFPNVKAALSGHVHLADNTEYLGVNYYCNGAASGGWWAGKYQEFGPSYAVIDFYNDGTITSELKFYNI